ncbi:disease resistance protein [Trifolium medium]|uniref:Disease resistance protein n=1 Tax=Trifolium medium TaxID=97028 RepID=A0A392MB31_9FABA|nr:disease resistance protein [Trifolium medium]
MCSLWIALGLVQSLNGSEKLEHVARNYIDELHSRSFLQDVDDFGSSCEFKVHDLIHDLALYVAREDFVAVDSHIQNIPPQARHLSVVENDSLDHYLFPKSKSLRSILFPVHGVGLASERVLDTWVSRYKYLRYLDLSDSSIKIVPNSLAKLGHLRFLDLSRNDRIKRLPNSICKLLNLQVLLLSGCTELEELPKGLGKLISLRRLIVTTKQSTLPHDEFASLNHLQSLSFHDCDNLKLMFRQQLPSIEELHFESCGSLECLPLYIFPKLQTLYINDCQMLNLSLNSPIQELRMKYLILVNYPGLLALPRWTVGIADTLETLLISDLPDLKMLPECLTTMFNLKRIYIHNCPQLLCLPSDMHRLTALEDLRIVDCPELCRKCLPQSGEYWPMISHIKGIFIEEPRGEEE